GAVVHVNEADNFGKLQAQPLAPECQPQTRPVACSVYPVAALASGCENALVFVEAQGAWGNGEFARQFGDCPGRVGHGGSRKNALQFTSTSIIMPRIDDSRQHPVGE